MGAYYLLLLLVLCFILSLLLSLSLPRRMGNREQVGGSQADMLEFADARSDWMSQPSARCVCVSVSV